MRDIRQIVRANGRLVWDVKQNAANQYYAVHKYTAKISGPFKSLEEVEKFIEQN